MVVRQAAVTTASRRCGAEVEEDVPPSQLGIGKRFVWIPPPRDGHGSPTIAAWFGGARLVRRGHAHARDTSHASAAVNECVYANHRPGFAPDGAPAPVLIT